MKTRELFYICLSSLILSGCGGSSNNSNSTSSPEPYFQYAWHLNSKDTTLNAKGFNVDSEADISIADAWSITKGSGVKVAVIDDAFDVEHEDLKANIAVTYNVDENSDDVTNKYPASHEYGTSHGNTCAGFIVAPENNKGSVGVAPESKLIAIKLLSISDADTIKAFEYAKQQNAKVISCSWGTENMSQALNNELKTIYDAGITVVFASGNDGKTLDDTNISDESESEWVIGVGASAENNDVTYYSNYGSNIDLIAPGGDTNSLGILGIDDSGSRGSTYNHGLVNEDYAFVNGTSFSTPVVAGVIALMYAANPNITPKQVRDILIASADKIGSSSSNYVNGFDTKRAYGKINAGKAVSQAKGLTSP